MYPANSSEECAQINTLNRNLEAIIPLLYAIPATIFYIRIILLIINTKRKPEFATSFYRLFVISAIANITHWILYYVTLRMPRAPCFNPIFSWLPHKGILITLLLFFSFYTFYAHLVCFLLITLNRFTFIVFPNKAVQIWKYIQRSYLFVILVLPFLFSWHIMLNKPRLILISPDCQLDGYIFQATVKRFGMRNSLYMLILAVVGAITELVMNSAVLMVLFNRPKFKSENTMRSTEIKLFIFTLMMFIWQAIFVVLQIFFYIDSMLDWDIVWTLFGIQQYIVDVMSLSPPFFLVMMSSDIRKALKNSWPFQDTDCERRRSSAYRVNMSNGTEDHLISKVDHL